MVAVETSGQIWDTFCKLRCGLAGGESVKNDGGGGDSGFCSRQWTYADAFYEIGKVSKGVVLVIENLL